jgi:hypothetical protein
MKKLNLSLLALFFIGLSNAQETPDTTRFSIGTSKIIIINPKGAEVKIESDTVNAEPDEEELNDIEAHWSGLDFGPTLLLNQDMKASFPNDPQWENDPGKSFSWSWNVLEHKFPIYKNYVGITTGLGINWTQIGLKQNVLQNTVDSLFATTDSVNVFRKNKLRAIYLTAPLMIEFCGNEGGDEGFYLAAGVIGGVRIGSSVKTVTEGDSKTKQKSKGTYGLEAFRLDAALRMGFDNWGVYVNYNVIPLFDTEKTAAVHPLTFGVSLNF